MPRRKTGPLAPPNDLFIPFKDGVRKRAQAEDRRALAREIAIRDLMRARSAKASKKPVPQDIPTIEPPHSANPSPTGETSDHPPPLLTCRVSLPRCLFVPKPAPSEPIIPEEGRETSPEAWSDHQIAVAILEAKAGEPQSPELRQALLARRKPGTPPGQRIRCLFFTKDGRRARAKLPAE